VADDVILNKLTDADDMDVDLMASGCRVQIRAAQFDSGVEELLELYGFDAEDLVAVLGVLMSEGVIEGKALFRAAEQVAGAKAGI
jgi:hypothetical protein